MLILKISRHLQDSFDISPKFQVRQVSKRNWNPMLQTWITVTNFLCLNYLQGKGTKKTHLLCLCHIYYLISGALLVFLQEFYIFLKKGLRLTAIILYPLQLQPVVPPCMAFTSTTFFTVGLVNNSFTFSLLFLTTSHLCCWPLHYPCRWKVGIINK